MLTIFMYLEIQSKIIIQEKEIKTKRLQRRNKIISIYKDVIYSIKRMKGLQKAILINEQIQYGIGFKINIQKSVAYLYSSNGQSEERIKK